MAIIFNSKFKNQSSKFQIKIQNFCNFKLLHSNFNFSFLTFKFQSKTNGFTLVELLVSVSVFAIISIFAVGSFSGILQTSGKTEVTQTVRQEADYVTSVLERHLRGALNVVCAGAQITYQDQTGTNGSFSCQDIGESDPRIASGSARLTSDNVSITSCSLSCTATEVTVSFGMRQRKVTNDPRETSSMSVSSRIILRNQ